MLDFIIALIVLAGLVWAFSGAPVEEEPSQATGMYLSVQQGEPAPQPMGEVVSPSAGPLLAPETSDKKESKRPKPSEPEVPEPTKTIDELAWEVIIGLWDCTETRWQMLTEAGYDAQAVQNRVNEILNGGI